MMKRLLVAPMLAAVLSCFTGGALAADQAPPQEKPQTQVQVYGSQLMTQQERNEHRTKMRAAKTTGEREQIRKEHHESMKERARERGVTLPDNPPARGGGMGLGGGSAR